MHLVHHPHLHHGVLVVVDGLVVEPHRDIDPRGAQRHDWRDAVAHVEVAARVAGDGDPPAAHQLDLGLGDVNGVAIGDVALDEPEIVEPKHRRLAVPAQTIGFLHRRLQQVHVDHHSAAFFRLGAHPAQKALAGAVRPRGGQQDPRIGVVVSLVKLVEQAEIVVGERLLVEEDKWPGRLL